MTLDWLHVSYYRKNRSKCKSFIEWFQSLKCPSGKQACATTLDTLHEICGDNVGDIDTPLQNYMGDDMAWIVIGVDNRDACLKCYLAIRVRLATNTAIIDLLGVHESLRRQKAGSTFYNLAMQMLHSEINDELDADQPIKFILQSTYLYPSYIVAIVETSRLCKKNTYKLNQKRIIDRLDGSCRFWKSLGFDHAALKYGATLKDPALIMWKYINKS